MKEPKWPKWIDRRPPVLLHRESLSEHGGHAGVLDEGLLDSALARPCQIFSYEAKPDLARLAAAYGVGLVRDHLFADGNKRAAFLAVGLFLGLNGFRLLPDQADATRTVLALAAGEMSEEEFAAWIRTHHETPHLSGPGKLRRVSGHQANCRAGTAGRNIQKKYSRR